MEAEPGEILLQLSSRVSMTAHRHPPQLNRPLMSHPFTSLQGLTREAPVCVCTPQTRLSEVFHLFVEATSEVLVCVNAEQHPMGFLALENLLVYLDRGVITSPVTVSELLEPLPGLSTTAAGLGPILSVEIPEKSRYYALVNDRGEFDGLIEGWRLLTVGHTPWRSPDLQALQQVLEHIPLPLLLQADHGAAPIYTNRAWQEQLGDRVLPEILYLAEHLPALTAVDFCLEALPEQHPAIVNLGSEVSPKTWQLVKFPLTPLPEHPPLWMVMARDITEYRQLCQELAAKNADLIQLNRLKDEFLACITHELKTPLTAVLGLASLLKDAKLGALNARQSHYAQLIHQSGRHLMNVVNDILDLTRLETGQLRLQLTPVKLHEVCAKAYQQARQILKAGNDDNHNGEYVQFRLDLEPGLTTIVADATRLCQMLSNLLSNALKFTPAGGEIGLQVSRWQGWVDFTIWDTGIGIPESVQHLLFQKFQQLESPLNREFQGTGLGLVLTQRLARAHGGDVSFVSKAGEGSRFTLLLPPSPPGSRPAKQAQQPPHTTVSSQLVLIVEATAQYIERLTQQLYELGYRVLVARSGTEALEKARLMQPRMIFLNPLIPLLSGWDVLTLLKADPNTQNIPVLVTATQAEKQQARQHGADGFLALPIAKAALQKSLAQLQQDSVQRSQLTILCLPVGETASVTPLQYLLQSVGESLRDQTGTALSYRILEADGIEQAALLARVWQPDVLILDGQPEHNPAPIIDAIATTPTLATLPLITLDAIATQRAHPYTNLTVYPCLMSADQISAEILLQVIQVAAGMQRQPHILVMDVGQPLSEATVAVSPPPAPAAKVTITGAIASPLSFPTFPPSSHEFLQALSQYLCTAGFRVTIVQDGRTLPQQIAQHQCDLLLLYWSDRPLQRAWLPPIEQSCTQVSQKLPTILLRHCAPHRAIDKGSEEHLEQLCDHTVEYTSTFAMEELLTVIKKTLD